MKGHDDKNKSDSDCPYKKETLKEAYFLGKKNENKQIIKSILTK